MSGAYSFDGANQDITVPDSAVLSPAGDFTVSAWIRPGTATGVSLSHILSKFNNTGPYGGAATFVLAYDSTGTKLRFIVDGNNRSTVTSGVTFSDTAKWYYVVGERSGNAISLYINNVLAGSVFISGSTVANSSPLMIGGDPSEPLFKGSISDVRIYNRALSQDDLSNLYNSYNSQINLYSPPGSNGNGVNLTAGLVGYWPFNGNAKDATPYSDDGTVSGATLTTGHTGQANSAYQTGDTQYISIGSPVAYNNLGQAFTYSVWVKSTGASSKVNPQIMGATNTHTTINIRGGDNGSRIYTEYATSPYAGSTFVSIGSVVLPVNAWSLYTVTYDGSMLTAYFNGVAVQSAGPVILNPTFGGLRFSDDDNGFAGALDDPRVYNRALSAAEVQALYNLPD